MIHLLTDASILFARGGGGGSGGGGGGGDGGIFAAIFAIGYVPMHFLGGWFRRMEKKNEALYVMLQIIGWVVAVIFSILCVIIGRGWGVIAGAGSLTGMAAGLYGLFGKLKKNKIAEAHLSAAAAADSAWHPEALLAYSNQVFARFQSDWSTSNTESMKQYMTPWYHYHVSLMMMAMGQAKRQNRMDEVQIINSSVQAVQDAEDNSQDRVTIGFQAKANDQLIDTRSNKVIFADKNEFVEYWNFERSGDTWLLGGIDQQTANTFMGNENIRQFAAQNQMCYSLDWGWLLLPQWGQLFGRTGKFGTSDINNHVIGVVNNNLVQIYTYTPNNSSNTDTDGYLVAQMQVPHTYGEILVRRKKGLLSKSWFSTKGLDKISMEWPDFNKKYEVFASTGEGPTSCELVHPTFMEKLEAMPFEVNLEVVDNMVYFYTKETGLNPQHYPAMLSILQEAFKQMKM